MKHFHRFIERWILTIWPGIIILGMNAICTYGNIVNGVPEWMLFVNAIGVAFAIRIIVTWYHSNKEHKKTLAEIKEMERRFKETMERHKSHLDESNSDKS